MADTPILKQRGALRFLTGNLRWLGAGFLLTFVSSFGQTYFIGLFTGEIRAEFGLSHGQYGMVYMIATLLSAGTLVWFGKIVDKTTIRNAGAITLLGLAVACLIIGYAQAVLVLGLGIYLARLFGQGMCGHVAMTGIGRWYRANRGRALSIAILGFPVAEAIFPSLVVLLIASHGWRATWIYAGLAAFVLALPLFWAILRTDRVPRSDNPLDNDRDNTNPIDWTRAQVIRDWRFWALLPGILAQAYLVTGLFFHQVHLIAVKGWEVSWFAANFSVYAVVTVVLALIAGELIDRFGAVRLLAFYPLPMAAGLLIAGLGQSPLTVPVFMFLLGISSGMAGPLFGAVWPEIYGTGHLGAIRALIFACMVFSSALAPGLIGLFVDHGIAMETQLVAGAFYTIVASWTLWLLRKPLQRREPIHGH